jgi:hypothetical protein
MRNATRVRVVSQPLAASLTRAQTLLACDVAALYRTAAALAAGQPAAGADLAMLHAVGEVLSCNPAELVIHVQPDPDKAPAVPTARAALAIADGAAVEQRGLLASTIANTLMAANWTVTVVDGGAPERYTGIEATRGTEHVIVGVGAGELIADQASSDDRWVVDVLIEGLREIGCAVAIAEDPAGPGSGGSLYALRGGPSLAHAIQALLPGSERPVIQLAAG